MEVIGLAGLLASGKGELVQKLKSEGYVQIRLSQFIEEELRTKGMPVTRETLITRGSQLRSTYGNDILAKKALERINQNTDVNYVIDGIRDPAEAKYLKENLQKFTLIAVSASKETRMRRAIERRRDVDPQAEQRLIEAEARDRAIGVDECIQLADFVIKNERKTIQELHKELDVVLTRAYIKRPSWDEYFINLIKTIAQRATCDRGMSGAIIVKDKKILSTGYVGAPAGLPHCSEAGHLFRQMINEDGKVTTHCLRTAHAEQNAIVQAAKHGIAIEGATLYCKLTPCLTCAKMIINSGIKRVVAEKDYHVSGDSKDFFKQAGVKLEILGDVEIYPKMN